VYFPLFKTGEIHMNELQIVKTFIKYRVLLLNQFTKMVDRLDVENFKDDLRKVGITFVGAAFLGIILQKSDLLPGLLLLLVGLYLWYQGLTK
jgi:hypothetical protein